MTGPDQIWSEAVRTLERDQPFVLATVINVRGSTPREVGAKMIVRADGQVGTIGGGCGEAEVFRKARLMLSEGVGAKVTEVDLTGDFDQQQIGTCGGIMDVFVDLWLPPADLAVARHLAASAEHNRPAALLTLVDPGGRSDLAAGARTLIDPAKREPPEQLAGLSPAALAEIAERASDSVASLFEVESDGSMRPVTHLDANGAPRLFLDPISGAQRLIIVGAGHIAQPLAALGSMLGFHVTVIDDRASFANRERFPTADEIIVRPFAAAVDSIRLDRHCYLLSVTRGHAFDEETLRAALMQSFGLGARADQAGKTSPFIGKTDPFKGKAGPFIGKIGPFIGMIGSRRRVKATLARLECEGVPPALLDEVHAPLGLDLGAETPEEIALAIMAEIIRERRTGVRDQLTLGTRSGRLRPRS
jgi:xanthine dehydrogenase accessory factor